MECSTPLYGPDEPCHSVRVAALKGASVMLCYIMVIQAMGLTCHLGQTTIGRTLALHAVPA